MKKAITILQQEMQKISTNRDRLRATMQLTDDEATKKSLDKTDDVLQEDYEELRKAVSMLQRKREIDFLHFLSEERYLKIDLPKNERE